MPLKPVFELFSDARARCYALGYFESWNLESLQGVIDAAEQTRSPIIIGFNGEFLTRPGRLAKENIAWYGALGRAAAESASVPCGVIFNECPNDGYVHQAVLSDNFNLVMLSNNESPFEDYQSRVASLVQLAHQHGVAVEAEIDELPNGSTGKMIANNSQQTDAELAAQFVSATGIDLLAVSVGNIHILLEGQQAIDLDHLAAIHKQVPIPLVLHGGSGIPADSLRAAVQMGVVKVNFGTYLKQRYLAAVRQALASREINPHLLLGMGGREDVLVAGRLAVRDAVLERIEVLGCCGKA